MTKSTQAPVAAPAAPVEAAPAAPVAAPVTAAVVATVEPPKEPVVVDPFAGMKAAAEAAGAKAVMVMVPVNPKAQPALRVDH